MAKGAFMTSALSASVAPGIRAGLHVCGMFATDEEREAMVVPFLRRGAEHGDRLVYVADPTRAKEAIALLRRLPDTADGGRGQVELWDARDLYLNGGGFDPGHILATLDDEVERTLASGYAGLRLVAEMPATVGARLDPLELAAYERNVSDAITSGRLAALCQYDRRLVPPALLTSCATAHPIHAQTQLSEDAPLTFTAGSQLVRVAGEVDLTTAEHFAVLVGEHLAPSGDVHLDLGDLAFIDAQGVRSLLRARRALGSQRRLVVHRPPAVLQEALAVLPPRDIVLTEAA